MTGQQVLQFLSSLSEEQLNKSIIFDYYDWKVPVTNIGLAYEDFVQLYDEEESQPTNNFNTEELDDILDNDFGYISCNKGDIVIYG